MTDADRTSTIALIVVAVAMLGVPSAAAQNIVERQGACTWHVQNFSPGSRVNNHLFIPAGHSGCGRTLRSEGAFTFERVRIVARPRNGIATTSGVSGYGYRPNPGFRGADAFTVEITMGGGNQGAAIVDVVVAVQ